MKVKKRNGSLCDYNKTKIAVAISNANKDVTEDEKISIKDIDHVIENLESQFSSDVVEVETIQDLIEIELMKLQKFSLAKAYICYRLVHSFARESNTTDGELLSLIRHTNKNANEENSNKNPMLLSTQRDYIAGITSIDITNRLMLPERIKKAHEDGVLHFHDEDYFLQEGMFNCCLINIEDMLDNGTVMNGKLIESPKSFQVACTVMTQIVAAVASNQYGGQSINMSHLGKYLRKTFDKFYNRYIKKGYSEEMARELAEEKTQDDLEAGVQTIQYQINTLMTSNG